MKTNIYFDIPMYVKHLPSIKMHCVPVCFYQQEIWKFLCVHIYIYSTYMLFSHISILPLQRGCENLENTFKGHVDISREEMEKQAEPGLSGLGPKCSSQTSGPVP